MVSSLEYVEYICEQLALAGTISYKRMFGEYGIYCDGKYFAAICDDRFLVKITEAGEALMGDYEKQEPYPGGKPMFFIENVEDREFLAHITLVTCAALPTPKPRKKKASKKASTESPEYPQENKPSMEDIDISVANPLWENLCSYLESNYSTQPAIEYSKCGMEPGWNVKYKKGGKSLCTLYPREGYFACMVVAPEKHREFLEGLQPNLSEYTQQLFQETRLLNGGWWLFFEVTTPEILQDALTIIDVRGGRKGSFV